MNETFKRPESVLVVLYSEAQQVLVLQRKDDNNFWQSVTGSMEAFESPIDTALREVQEEIGIQLSHPLAGQRRQSDFLVIDCRWVNQYQIRDEWQYRYGPGITVNFEYVFVAKIPLDVKIKLTEHLCYRWLKKSDAIDKVWSTSNKLAIDKFVPDA